jgi:ubiquinone/menaquinone biosynthesis C-methylase UbiE
MALATLNRLSQSLDETDRDDVLRREAEFHDALAASLRPSEMPPRALDHLELALMEELGDISGLSVLDYGCGIGDLSLELAGRGGRVTGLDLSPGMVEVARNRMRSFRPEATSEFVAANAEDSGLPDGSFDVIVGKWILHHIDVDAACRELRRLMRPGGFGVFIENQLTNPLLRVARDRVAGRFGIPRYGTADEHPLDQRDYEVMRRHFESVRATYPDFYFARLFARQVLRHRIRAASELARATDDLVYARAPRLRRFSFHVIVRLS